MSNPHWSVRIATVAVLAAASAAQSKIPALVVSGANNHDWEWTAPSLERMLEETGRFDVDVTYEPSAALADGANLARYRLVVLDYNGPRWGDAADAAFLQAVRDGVGVAVVHAADNAF